MKIKEMLEKRTPEQRARLDFIHGYRNQKNNRDTWASRMHPETVNQDVLDGYRLGNPSERGEMAEYCIRFLDKYASKDQIDDYEFNCLVNIVSILNVMGNLNTSNYVGRKMARIIDNLHPKYRDKILKQLGQYAEERTKK